MLSLGSLAAFGLSYKSASLRGKWGLQSSSWTCQAATAQTVQLFLISTGGPGKSWVWVFESGLSMAESELWTGESMPGSSGGCWSQELNLLLAMTDRG